MAKLREWLIRIWETLRPRRDDRDLEAELRLHLELAEENARRGAGSPEGGARAARIRAGGMAQAMEALRDQHSLPWLRDLGRDVRYACRTLARRPTFSVAALLTIALGVGASVSIFSVVNGVLLRPLPYPEAHELTLVWEVDERATPVERRNYVSVANYGDWRSENRVFERMAAFQISDARLRLGDETEQVMAAFVSPGFLETLGAQPVVGRPFTIAEASPEREDVVVIGYALWQQRYGGDPGVLGQAGSVSNRQRTVVGVLPPGFDFLSKGVQLLVPVTLTPADFENRRAHRLQVVARLRTGVSVEQAQIEMNGLADRIRSAHPEWMTGWGVNVAPLFDEVVGGVRPTLLVLLGAVGFVLLIATFNVATLLLGRATVRQRELAVRTALGAGWAHLIRQLVTESLLLALAGGAGGLIWAVAATRALIGLAPTDLPRAGEITIDSRVLLFGMALSVVAGLACGMVPAWHAMRTDPSGALADGGRGGSRGRAAGRLRSALVVSELAFSLVLLIGAGLMIRTMAHLLEMDPGYRADNVLTTTITLPSRYDGPVSVARFFDELMDDIRIMPGVDALGATRFPPFAEEWTFSFLIEGHLPPREGEKRDYGLHPISVDYFDTMGMMVVGGRSFTDRDYNGPPVVIVNEAMRRRFWPDQDPLGQRIKFAQDAESDEPWLEVVGVVRDVRQQGLDVEPRPAVYTLYGRADAPFWSRQMSLAIRTTMAPLDLVPALRDLLRARDRGLILTGTRTLSDAIADSLARRRFAMILLGLFAVAALALASIGIYSVVAHAVGQRIQEMGIRMALGASHPQVLALVIGQGVAPVAVGLGVGLAVSLLVTRYMRTLLYGVAATDPLTLLVVTLLLTAVSAVACCLPARRATKVDPLIALRSE